MAELEAIGRAIAFAEDTGCALHIVHVSSGRGVALVAEARARGVDVTCETCPHYLFLTPEDVETLGAVAKCAPPVRPDAERQPAVAAVSRRRGGDGHLGPLALPARAEGGRFGDAWGGIACCQTTRDAAADRGDLPPSSSRG